MGRADVTWGRTDVTWGRADVTAGSVGIPTVGGNFGNAEVTLFNAGTDTVGSPGSDAEMVGSEIGRSGSDALTSGSATADCAECPLESRTLMFTRPPSRFTWDSGSGRLTETPGSSAGSAQCATAPPPLQAPVTRETTPVGRLTSKETPVAVVRPALCNVTARPLTVPRTRLLTATVDAVRLTAGVIFSDVEPRPDVF